MSFSVMLLQLLRAFGVTFSIFALTLLGALPLGVPVALCRMSKLKPLRWLAGAYISIMRGTPLMLQLMVVYYGPGLLLGVTLPDNWRFLAVILAFVINYAAYFGEIFRGGLQSIDRGQSEAAQALGYTRSQTFLFILLPQALRRTLPAVANEVITLVKDTSLASVIGTVEMFTRAKMIVAAPRSPGLLTYLAAGVFYWLFNAAAAWVMELLERKLRYEQ